MGTNTEIHFLPVDESHTHALSRNTKPQKPVLSTLAIQLGYLYCKFGGAELQQLKLQCIQYFKSVFLEILNVHLRSVFVNPVTYTFV